MKQTFTHPILVDNPKGSFTAIIGIALCSTPGSKEYMIPINQVQDENLEDLRSLIKDEIDKVFDAVAMETKSE